MASSGNKLDFYGKLHKQRGWDMEFGGAMHDGDDADTTGVPTSKHHGHKKSVGDHGHKKSVSPAMEFLDNHTKKDHASSPSNPPLGHHHRPDSKATGTGKASTRTEPLETTGTGRTPSKPSGAASTTPLTTEYTPGAVRNPFIPNSWLPASAFKPPETPGDVEFKNLMRRQRKSPKGVEASPLHHPAKPGVIKALNLPTMTSKFGPPIHGVPDPHAVIRPLQLPSRTGPVNPVQPLDLPGVQSLQYGNHEYGLPIPAAAVMTPASAAAAIANGVDPNADPQEQSHYQFLFGAGRAPLFMGMPAPHSLHGMSDQANSASFLSVAARPPSSNLEDRSSFLEITTKHSWPKAGLCSFVSMASFAEAAGHHLYQSMNLAEAGHHALLES